jgi:hypothetical protein
VLLYSDLFQTGILVDDILSAKKGFADLLGLTWLEGEGEVSMRLAEGPLTMAFAYPPSW